MESKSGSKSSISDRPPRVFRRRIKYPAAVTLPAEVIEEIMLKLPVRSLLKFRCVSKSWRSLISSNRFIKAHLQISREDTNFTRHGVATTFLLPRERLKQCSVQSLFCGLVPDAVDVDFSIEDPKGKVCVGGICDGLFCIVVSSKLIFLWNPSTRKFKKLPDADDRLNQSLSVVDSGLGFDESNEDYKVFVVFTGICNDVKDETIVKIYSLRTNSWKKIKFIEYGLLLGESGKFVSGNLHWIRINGTYSQWDIVSFDLGSEICGKIAPPNYLENYLLRALGVLGGCLCVFYSSPNSKVDVWVMKEYGVSESWAKMVTVPYIRLPSTRPSMLIPLCIGPKGEILLVLGWDFLIYNPTDNCFRHPKVRNFGAFLDAHVYCESLVALV